MANVALYDTTLRDGTQMEGVSLSAYDKLRIAERLDQLGVHFIEGGWPGSNATDREFFQRAKSLPLQHASIVAFGSTRRANSTAEADENIKALLESEAPVVTLVGKSSEDQVTRALGTSLDENLAMIRDSIAYLKGKGRRVFFDAEHFFDGYRANSEYSLQCIRTAAEAGAEYVVLCDTNGGTMPIDVFATVKAVSQAVDCPIGIHAHNDSDVAVANTIAAIEAGATQAQASINGYGERCGNANLLSVIANLKLKLGIDVVTDEQLSGLTEAHRFTAEIANMPRNRYQPYVGESAFAHKGGLHVSAVIKDEAMYQHVPPELVGNANHIVISELSGRSNVAIKLEEVGLAADVPRERHAELLTRLKERESQGFQYDGAEASFSLLVRRTLPGYKAPFELVDLMVVMEKRRRESSTGDDALCEAVVKLAVGGDVLHTVAAGNGPVNALDQAMRKALLESYPRLHRVKLTDYKVRVVPLGPESDGTGAVVRVLVDSTDGERAWSTVGASTNIIEASWQALADSLEYALLLPE